MYGVHEYFLEQLIKENLRLVVRQKLTLLASADRGIPAASSLKSPGLLRTSQPFTSAPAKSAISLKDPHLFSPLKALSNFRLQPFPQQPLRAPPLLLAVCLALLLSNLLPVQNTT
jgi:hypothetical protein